MNEIVHGTRFVDFCRAHGWEPGTIVERRMANCTERYAIVAIGKESVLVSSVDLANDELEVAEGTERAIHFVEQWIVLKRRNREN